MTDIILSENQIAYAKKLGISEAFLRLLLMRGLTEEEIPSFLSPSLDDMQSPFAIDGMREAAERVKKAIDEKQKVLVFGDYDCDGVGAVAILTLYLRDKLDVKYFIPDRNKDGYGMTVDALQEQVKHRRPDLVITVDCGITSVAEVDYLRSEGIDVVVTDHHEPQDVLPNCIIVDAKVKREGFYDFCGAGVALKLVEALAGRAELEKYIDIAAISTIADVVPLHSDNRIIAYYGLKKICARPRPFISYLLGSTKLSSTDVMFKLAPRINAAGRLSSAMEVVDLFLEEDPCTLRSLSERLNRQNQLRQEICERAVEEAKRKLKGIDFDKTRIILLSSSNWEAGILGIAAARLCEEFKCPAILFAEKDGELKGSARSIKAVNIFEVLSKFSELFITFGGHSQAAGVTMKAENFEKFKELVNAEIIANYDYREFLPKIEYDMQLDPEKDQLPFAKELELLEPTGYGNPKPNFLIRGENFRFDRIGFTKHIKCVTKGMELVGFSKFLYCLGVTRGRVEIELTLGVNVYQNRQYAQGIIRTFNAETVALEDEECAVNSVHQLEHEGEIKLPTLNLKDTEKLLEKPFGTLIVCFNQSEYENLCRESARIAALPVLIATPRCLNPENCVLLVPAEIFDFTFYKNAVIAGKPLTAGYPAYIASQVKHCYALGDCTPRPIHLEDSAIRAVYAELRTAARNGVRFQNYAQLDRTLSKSVKLSRFDFVLICRILADLGLISLSDKGIITVSGEKTELSRSAVYRNLSK